MKLNFEQHAPIWAEKLNLKKVGATEYNGVCPACGGDNRFWINSYNGELRHHCRQKCDFVARANKLREIGLLPEYPKTSDPVKLALTLTAPYHLQKRIELLGSGATCDGDTLSIELFDLRTGARRGAQLIIPDGSKKFTPNLKKECTGAFIGDKTKRIYVVEGWADAVVVHRATGDQAFFALDANTLPPSAKELAKRGYEVVIAADNDQAGLSAAEASGLPYA